MATPYERVKSAWDSEDRRPALHRVVEEMAADGLTRDALDDALGQLLDEIRAAGADDDTEEIIMGIGDRLHGWCHESCHIKTQSSALPTNGSQAGAARTIQTSVTVLPGGRVEVVSPDLPVGRSVSVTITVPGSAAG
jgi:hypothetical protein